MSWATWLIAAADYNNPRAADNSGWDTLYIVLIMGFILLVVAGVATWFNRRDDRRA